MEIIWKILRMKGWESTQEQINDHQTVFGEKNLKIKTVYATITAAPLHFHCCTNYLMVFYHVVTFGRIAFAP